MSSVENNSISGTTTTAETPSPSTATSPSSCNEGDCSNSQEDIGSSSSSIIPHQPVRPVLDALSRFQTCLLILSSTVLRLQESLHQFIPRHSSVQGSSGSASTMPGTSTTRQFSRRSLSQVDASPENNNVIKEGREHSVRQHTDVELNLSSDPIPGSIPVQVASNTIITTVSDCSGMGNVGGNEDQHKQESTKQEVNCFAKLAGFFVKYIGIFLALFASVCMSLVTLVVKYLEQYHPVSKVIWRLQGVLAPSFFILLYVRFYLGKPVIIRKNTEEGTNRWKLKILILLVIRGLVGCSADIFQYYSLKYLPLADSTVLSFSTPIFVCLVAHFVLKEKCGVVPIVTALITLSGVIVITKPPLFTGQEEMGDGVLLGSVLGILCMMSATLTTVIMRYLKHVHFAMTMMALGIVGTVEGLIVTLFTSPFEIPLKGDYQDLALAFLIIGLFFFGQLAQTLALQHEEAGVVSLVRTCDVLFAFIWQVNLLHQKATLSSYTGAFIVTIGVAITGLRKWVDDMPDHNPVRRKLHFILK